MNNAKPFAAAAGETTGAGFVAPKTLTELQPAPAIPARQETTTIYVAQGGWAMPMTVPKLSAEEAARRSLEVHAAARERNARNDALRRQKQAALTKTLG